MFFFKKKPEFVKPELISLHIYKAAGTSFFNTLKVAYGEQMVGRLDIKPEIDLILLNFEIFTEKQIMTNYKVIHGHFSPNFLYNRFPEYQDIPIITWVRSPVERVISNYYYLSERLAFFLQEHEQIRSIRDKMQKTLDEFIDAEINQNLTYNYLGGLELEAYDFIGIVEDYDADLAYLSKLLNWQNSQKFTVNVTEKIPRQIDPQLRKKIELANEKDMAIYEKALSLKGKRKSI